MKLRHPLAALGICLVGALALTAGKVNQPGPQTTPLTGNPPAGILDGSGTAATSRPVRDDAVEPFERGGAVERAAGQDPVAASNRKALVERNLDALESAIGKAEADGADPEYLSALTRRMELLLEQAEAEEAGTMR